VSFLPRSVPLLSPPRVASPLPPNARAALPLPPPHVAAHHLLGRFPASDIARASDGQQRRVLIDPLHGQHVGDAPTPRHLLHLRASLLDAPQRHGATAIFVPPSPAPTAQPPPLPTAPKCPPATLPPAPTSDAAAVRPDWIGNAATDSPSPSSPAPSPPTATSFSGVTMGFSFWMTTTRLASLLPTPEQISQYQCPKLQWRHVTRVCTGKEDNGYRTTLLTWDPG
jgi:hypothetical protein